MFSNADNGLATRFAAFADTLIGSGGLLDSRENTLNRQIRDTESARTNLEFRHTQKEAALVAQFSTLDALIATMNTTSSFLSTQLEQIAATTQSSNGG